MIGFYMQFYIEKRVKTSHNTHTATTQQGHANEYQPKYWLAVILVLCESPDFHDFYTV